MVLPKHNKPIKKAKRNIKKSWLGEVAFLISAVDCIIYLCEGKYYTSLHFFIVAVSCLILMEGV